MQLHWLNQSRVIQTYISDSIFHTLSGSTLSISRIKQTTSPHRHMSRYEYVFGVRVQAERALVMRLVVCVCVCVCLCLFVYWKLLSNRVFLSTFEYIWSSLVPRLPDLFNAHEKRGGAWYVKSREQRHE